MRYILILLLLSSCSMSEVLETPIPRTKVDTTYIPRDVDTLKISDVPIGFEVSVESWEEDTNEISF